MNAPVSLLAIALVFGACSSPSADYSQDGASASMRAFQGAGPAKAVEIPNFTILSDQVAGGGYIGADQVTELPEKGYTTIINLRYPTERGVAEEAAAAHDAGIAYYSFPVSGGDFTLETADAIRRVIAEQDGHVLLHCASGGRVSAVWALVRALDEGLPPEEAARISNEEGCRPIPQSMQDRVRDQARSGIPLPNAE